MENLLLRGEMEYLEKLGIFARNHNKLMKSTRQTCLQHGEIFLPRFYRSITNGPIMSQDDTNEFMGRWGKPILKFDFFSHQFTNPPVLAKLGKTRIPFKIYI